MMNCLTSTAALFQMSSRDWRPLPPPTHPRVGGPKEIKIKNDEHMDVAMGIFSPLW